MSLIYFMLAAYGFTQILVYGKVFEKVRPTSHFFHCSMCVGWWVGIFLWAINAHTELFTFDYSITTAFLLACVSSGTSYIGNMIFGDQGINFKMWGEK